jgi:hypothetical protein
MAPPDKSAGNGTLGLRTHEIGYRAAALAYVALWAVFSWPWLSGRVTIPYDAKALFQAQLQFLASAFHSGQSPAWNPHTFVGVPQIADPQSFIFSPAVLLAALGPNPSFWLLDVYVFALLGIGGWAIFLVFKDRRWHPAAAVVAALCFAFGGSASWRMQHIGQVQSYAFFALAFWLLLRARDRRSLGYGALAGLAAGTMLAEPDQVALLACYLLAIVLLTDWLSRPSPLLAIRGDLPPMLVAAAVTLAVAALPVLLTYVFLAGSNRPFVDFAEAARGSLHPASLLTLLAPDLFGIKDATVGYWGPYSEAWDPNELTLSPNMTQLYMGALPAFLLVRGILRPRDLWHPEIRGSTLAAGFALLYALGVSTPVFRSLYDLVPGVAMFRRPADATFLLGGFLAIVAGYVLHLWLDGRLETSWRRQWVEGLAIAGLLMAGGLIAIRMNKLDAAVWPLAVAATGLAIAGLTMAWPRWRGGALAALLPVLFVGIDLSIANGPSEATGKPVERSLEVLRPDTTNDTITLLERYVRRKIGTPWRDRIEIAGVGFDWQNAAEAQGLDQTLGYNPLRTALVTRALGAGDYIAGPDQRRFSALFPSYRCRLADLLGLRYIASPVPIDRIDGRLLESDLHLFARTPDAFIYENPRALPRVLFVEQAMAADFERILADGIWPEFDPARTVLLEQSAGSPSEVGFSAAPAEPAVMPAIQRYENTRIDISVDATRPGYLVLSDVWHPWWTATIDGRPAEVRRANVMFRAVAVPPGRHIVRFEFEPIAGVMAGLTRLPELAKRAP